jgi:hypothetical protein
MKPRSLSALLLAAGMLAATIVLSQVESSAAQTQPGRVQRVTGHLQEGETDAYLLKDLRAGDRLTVSMRGTSGDLDPAIGIVGTSVPLEEVLARHRAEVQRDLATNTSLAQALESARSQTFLAWNDDSGEGYAAALTYVVPKPGDYGLITWGSLSAFGRVTSGDYELLLGLNAPVLQAGEAEPAGPPIAERVPTTAGLPPSVQEASGSLSSAVPSINLALSELNDGQTFAAYAEATSGNLLPILILHDYGGKPLEASNLNGQQPRATLQYAVPEGATRYSLEVQAATLPDGTRTQGSYRVLVGVNAPEVLTGQAQPQGEAVLAAPIEVKTGLRLLRISQVDSQDENYTVLANLRMDWTDPGLAFSPDTCKCSVRVYSDADFNRFLADVGSRWPAFTFFNQLGNRWTQSRTAAIWPDGRVRYLESFNTTFQADFDFRQYPFDTQTFPIYLDLVYPTSEYTLTVLPGYSEIDPEHGEDEFIISGFSTTVSPAAPSGADQPVSRLTFSFSAPRHLNYYLLQVFLPIFLIILISWFTFFLHDYTRRIEAAAANILLFIAFSFSLASNYPRLGYITFLDAIMAVTFVVNVLVLLYNVNMKRLEGQGMGERVQRIDNVLDWAYPVAYAALIGAMVLLFF